MSWRLALVLYAPLIASELVNVARRVWPDFPSTVELGFWLIYGSVVPPFFLIRTKPAPKLPAYLPSAATLASCIYIAIAVAYRAPYVPEAVAIGLLCIVLTVLRAQGITPSVLSDFIRLR